jgi:hypothetical protein
MNTNHWEKFNESITIETHEFFSQGSHARWHASPHCVDQHLVVQWLRGVAQTSSAHWTLQELTHK